METGRDRAAADEPTREAIDRTAGPLVLEFGASWCPYCQALARILPPILANHPGVRHVQIEDGRGRPLGRSFGVKLWPTLIFLRDGEVRHRAVRPDGAEVREGFRRIDP